MSKERNRPSHKRRKEPTDHARTARDWGPWLFLIVLPLLTLVAYHPAWHGGLVWDDDAHVTRSVLRSLGGLYRIWFDVRATLQYYPLLHTAFWIEHRLWGDATLWYHLANIFEHAGVALMLALILRRLAIPGAWFAAVVFALHPVHVESVAWISEQSSRCSPPFRVVSTRTPKHCTGRRSREIQRAGWRTTTSPY